MHKRLMPIVLAVVWTTWVAIIPAGTAAQDKERTEVDVRHLLQPDTAVRADLPLEAVRPSTSQSGEESPTGGAPRTGNFTTIPAQEIHLDPKIAAKPAHDTRVENWGSTTGELCVVSIENFTLRAQYSRTAFDCHPG